MIIPWHVLLRDALIFDRRLEHHALGELVDHAALDLLPGRLARRIFEAALLLQRRAARGELGVRNQDIGRALVEVDAHAVAGLEQGKPTARCRLGRSVENRGRARRAGLAAVAEGGWRGDAAFDQRRWRLHVDALGRAGIADRADAPDDQDGVL